MLSHSLLVEVQARSWVLNQPPAFLELQEILTTQAIDALAVLIGARRKTNLGTRDMEKALRISFGVGPCLVGSHHVVGGAGHLVRQFSGRSQTAKCSQDRQLRLHSEGGPVLHFGRLLRS